MPRPQLRVVSCLLFAALLVSGCSAEGEAGDDSTPPGEVDPATVAFPLDSYTSSDDSVRVFETARMYVAIDCLRDFGFEVEPWEPEGKPRINWSKWGLWDRDTAAEYGYASPPSTDGDQSLSAIPDEAWFSHVYDGYFPDGPGEHYYNGKLVPEGGCQGEGLRAIGETGDWDRNYQENLVEEAHEKATADERVQAKIAAWSECMAGAGYAFTEPNEPFGYWQAKRDERRTEQGERIPPDDAELAAASVDLGCKESTGLLSTWISVEIEFQEDIVAREGETLTDWAAQVDASLEKARSIIEEHEN